MVVTIFFLIAGYFGIQIVCWYINKNYGDDDSSKSNKRNKRK